MLIGENYKLESDSLNVTLYTKQTNKKTENVYWRPVAYFSSVKNALYYLVENEVMETGLKDLKTVVEKIDGLERLINGLELVQKTL